MGGPLFRRAAFDAASFLERDWQRRPRLLRQPWRQWRNPLPPRALAALARRAEVESRLVRRRRGEWLLEHGPFTAGRLARLPRRDWTLLVQAVNEHVPAVAALLEAFRFLPDWRVDDIMVSHAVVGGGVGPHFDRYDVFLVQGAGRRRWRLGGPCDDGTPCLPHDDLRLLADFTPREEWVLEPGDVLYLPPGIAHDGVALDDDCMTYSVGLRAPSRGDLIGHFCDHLLADLDDDDRYRDGALLPRALPGALDEAELRRLHRLVRERVDDTAAFADFFARYVSLRKYPAEPTPRRPVPARLRAALAAGRALVRHPASRLAWRGDASGGALYADGECYRVEARAWPVVRRLCGRGPRRLLARDVAAPAALELAAALHAAGVLVLDDAR